MRSKQLFPLLIRLPSSARFSCVGFVFVLFLLSIPLSRCLSRRISLGDANTPKARKGFAAPASDDDQPGPKFVHPNGTKIEVVAGRHAGRSGEIVKYAAVGWYSVVFKDSRDIHKVRSSEFRSV